MAGDGFFVKFNSEIMHSLEVAGQASSNIYVQAVAEEVVLVLVTRHDADARPLDVLLVIGKPHVEPWRAVAPLHDLATSREGDGIAHLRDAVSAHDGDDEARAVSHEARPYASEKLRRGSPWVWLREKSARRLRLRDASDVRLKLGCLTCPGLYRRAG